MVAGFGYVGISATDAIFLSVTLGLGMTLMGLIGGFLWMLNRTQISGQPGPADLSQNPKVTDG